MSVLVFNPSDPFSSSTSTSSQSSYAPTLSKNYKRNRSTSDSSSVIKGSINQSPSSISRGIQLVNGNLVQENLSEIVSGESSAKKKKVYVCTWSGCHKTYTKPIRLKEHERSHTNERPHACPHCPATYRRDTHLTAHMRMHLPEEFKPLVCGWVDEKQEIGTSQPCSKRFWTRQHWKVHRETMHEGKKGQTKFHCEICQRDFLKHHLLRTHHVEVHCVPGTKPFICSNSHCGKSFETGSKLRKHQKTHDEARYTCTHPDCLKNDQVSLQDRCFSTWTDLQNHTRHFHPPKCFHASCEGKKTFKNHKALRDHTMTFHLDQDLSSDSTSEPVHHPHPAQSTSSSSRVTDLRPAGPFKCCDYDNESKKCGKAYQSLRALQSHIVAVHQALPPPPSLDRQPTSSGHTLKRRRKTTRVERLTQLSLLTGVGYGPQDEIGLRDDVVKRRFACPAHLLHITNDLEVGGWSERKRCPIRYHRVYDVQRHLRSEHGLEVEREALKALFEGS